MLDIRFLTEKEVAVMTGISVHTLRNRRHRGVGFPYNKVGKSVRYSLLDVERFMAGCRVDPGAGGDDGEAI